MAKIVSLNLHGSSTTLQNTPVFIKINTQNVDIISDIYIIYSKNIYIVRN